MLNVLIGFLPLLFLFFCKRKKNNILIIYFIVFASIILIGSCCCVYYKVYKWPISPFNILVFFSFYAFGMSFYKDVKIDLVGMTKKNVTKRMDRFYLCPYLILFLIFTYLFLPKCLDMDAEQYRAVYEELRHGDMDKFENPIEKWANYIMVGLNIPTLIIGFAYLSSNSIKKGVFLLVLGVSAMIMNAVFSVSRSEFVIIGTLLFILYYLWSPAFSSKTKKYFLYTFLLLGVIMVALGIAITLSRAAFKTDNLWILDYFGLSPLTYNSVIEYDYRYTGGLYFLGQMEFFMSSQPSFEGNEFMPVIARMFVDFGVFGIFFFLLFIFIIIPRKVSTIADFYLIIYIFNILLFGIMYSKVQIKEVTFTLLIYLFLKFIFRKRKITFNYEKG